MKICYLNYGTLLKNNVFIYLNLARKRGLREIEKKENKEQKKYDHKDRIHRLEKELNYQMTTN